MRLYFAHLLQHSLAYTLRQRHAFLHLLRTPFSPEPCSQSCIYSFKLASRSISGSVPNSQIIFTTSTTNNESSINKAKHDKLGGSKCFGGEVASNERFIPVSLICVCNRIRQIYGVVECQSNLDSP